MTYQRQLGSRYYGSSPQCKKGSWCNGRRDIINERVQRKVDSGEWTTEKAKIIWGSGGKIIGDWKCAHPDQLVNACTPDDDACFTMVEFNCIRGKPEPEPEPEPERLVFRVSKKFDTCPKHSSLLTIQDRQYCLSWWLAGGAVVSVIGILSYFAFRQD